MINKQFILLLALLIVGSVSAAGIVLPYNENHPLMMSYGETKVVNFNFQNMVGDEDIVVKIDLKQGGDIASFEKDTYAVPLGSEVNIPLTIKIPDDYGKAVQNIEFNVNTVEQGVEEGMVGLSTGWRVSFDVIFSEKEVEKSTLVWIILGLVIALIVLLLLIFFVIKKRK